MKINSHAKAIGAIFATALLISAAPHAEAADLSIPVHSHTPDQPVLDSSGHGEINYYFTVHNNAGTVANGCTLKITKTGAQQYIGSASVPFTDNGDDTYTYTFGGPSTGGDMLFRIGFELSTPGGVSATAEILSNDDPKSGNNTAKESAAVINQPVTDLHMVSVTVEPQTSAVGDLRHYHGELRNDGPDDAVGVQIVIRADTTPQGQTEYDQYETFVGSSPEPSPAQPDANGMRFLPVGNLPANTSVTFDAYYTAAKQGSFTREFFTSYTDQEKDPNLNNNYVNVFSSIGQSGTPGQLSPIFFTVDDSASATSDVADSILRFAARQSSAVSGLKLHVQTSQTPKQEGSWVNLPDFNDGTMTLESTSNPKKFILNSANYPLQNKVYFRVRGEAPAYDPSTSNVVGPFNLATTRKHVGGSAFTMQGTSVSFQVAPAAIIHFAASENFAPAGTTVRVQTSTTPENLASWTDLPDGHDGAMQTGTEPTAFTLDSRQYPAGSGIYFRAIATAGTSNIPSVSNIIGPFTLVLDTPPVVTVTPPAKIPGTSGTGADQDHAIDVYDGSFHIAAHATSARSITSLAILYDGDVLDHFNGGSGGVDYTTNVPLIHTISAVAEDDLGTVGVAPTVFIRVLPRNARIFFLTSGGDWNTASNWTDTKGKHGVPGDRDVAIVGDQQATISQPTNAFAVLVNGGSISGSSTLTVTGYLVMTAGELRDMSLVIQSSATCQLLNDVDVAMNIIMTNFGTLKLSGTAGISGIGTAALHDSGAVHTNGFNPFMALVNWGKALFQRQATRPPARTQPKPRVVNVTTAQNKGKVAVNVHAGEISKAPVLANDGATLIGQDGNGLIGQDGNGVVSHDGGTFKLPPGAEAAAAAAATSSTGYVQSGGETNLDNLFIGGSVTLQGGVLTGSGVINGSLSNTGGYIMPGDSPGLIQVNGGFTQGANGTLILEVAGVNGAEFDHLNINGKATLDGKLDLKALDSYKTGGDYLNPIAYNSFSGKFSAVSSDGGIKLNANGMVAVVAPNAPQPHSGQPVNISTRMQVLGGDKTLIAGFIVAGQSGATKKVLIRGIGPSLQKAGIANPLADPFLELHNPDGSVVTNDDWQQGDTSQIPQGFAPSDSRESVITATLTVGSAGYSSYTAVLKGTHNETGIGLVEVYDIDSGTPTQLANISTRGFVDTGDNVMIGGFIIGGTEPAKVLVRGIGPSLAGSGVSGALAATVLEVHDANGAVLMNQGWRATQESDIIATQIPPQSDGDSAVLANLVPGSYTAILRGANNTTGIGLIEAYSLE